MAKETDPRMHSAEHLLNQAVGRLLGCSRCISAHIEKKKSKCDYRFGRALTAAEQKALEHEVNAVIAADLTVTVAHVSRAEAGRRFNLDRLPDDAGPSVRIVHIGDYDQCPCIGPHVASTAAIGFFRITSSNYANGLLRIRFKLDQPPARPPASQRKSRAGSPAP